MKMTTLCYLEKDGKYLMMHRIKKEKDVNKGKWIGVGGHVERGECPEECLEREVMEETGLTLLSYHSDSFQGNEISEDSCREGALAWVEKDRINELNLWEGDKIFLNLLREDAPFFSLKLYYEGDILRQVKLNGREQTRRPDGSWICQDTVWDASSKRFYTLSGGEPDNSTEFRNATNHTVQEFIRINNLMLNTDYCASALEEE